MLGANLKTKCVFFENNINSCGVSAYLMKYGERMFIFEFQLCLTVLFEFVDISHNKICPPPPNMADSNAMCDVTWSFGQILDCFRNGIEFTQTNWPKEAIHDFYDWCETGLT